LILVLLCVVLLASAAVLLLRRRGSGRRRLARLQRPAARSDGRNLRLLLDVLAGLGAVLVVGTWWAVPLGIAVGVGVDRFLRRREPAEVRAARLRIAADLPLSADLLAAVLRAGAPVDRALSAVADALGGPLGERLDRVGRSLRLLRADRSLAAEAAARRAGVLIVLPLGLCFLPAFLLAGLVPVVVAVIGDVL
jgi:Flp pilus assembly protein TadB